MDRLREYFARWNMALADMVMMLSVFSFLQNGRPVDYTNLAPFVGSFSLIILMDMVLAQKEVALIPYVLVNAFVSALFAGLMNFFLVFEEDTVGMRIVFSILMLFPYVHGAIAATGKVERKTIINYFDFLIILEVLFIATLGSALSFPPVLPVVGIVSLLGMQAVLVSLRLKTNDQGSRGKRIAGAIAMAAMIGAVCGLSFLLSRGFGIASVALIDGISWLMQNLYRIIMMALTAFFSWLLGILPDSDRYELPEVDENVVFNPRQSDVAEGNPIYFFIILGVLVLGIIIFFLAKLRGKRLKASEKMGPMAKRRRRSRISMGLKRMWHRICVEIRFRFMYMTHRRTPTGLFVWTEAFYRRRGAWRKKSETPSVYLRRIASSVAPEGVREEMLLLAEKLDEEYYGGRKAELPPSFPSSYRKGNKVLRISFGEYLENRKKQRLLML